MSVSAGRYTIRLASDPTKALMTPTGLPANGSNVVLGAAESYRALWDLTYRPDGTARILSSRAGKSADVAGASIQAGTNVQLYNDNSTRAQLWRLVDQGTTVTYGGTAYEVHAIAIAADTSLCMAASGSNVVLGASTGFILVPPEPLRSGGTYEVRSMLDTTMAVDVRGAAKTKGANVQLYKANGSNAQKFQLTDEGDGWSVRNIGSGMYVDVAGGSAQPGSNVQQWTDNDSRAQRWDVTQIGTTTVNGTECAVVRLGAFNATGLVMDVKGAMTTNSANVQIYTANASDAQAFALLPTSATDPNMPAPSGIGLATEVGGPSLANVWAQGTVYPTWSCPSSWASSGANHYEWRWSSRTLGADGSWSAWSGPGAWVAAPVAVQGDQAWVADGLPGTVSGKALQYQVEVRAVGVGETSSVRSSPASGVAQVDFRPTLAISGLTWTRDGLRVDYSSDYAAGTVDLDVRSVTSLGLPIVAEPHRTGFVDPIGSATIPVGDVNAFPSDGSLATVQVAVSTDVRRSSDVLEFEDVPVTVPPGTIELGLEAGAVSGTGGLPVTTDVAAALTLVAGGRAYPLGTGTEWDVPFPYDEPFEVRAYATSGADWGVETLRYPHGVTAPARAHGWLGASGLVTLALRRDEDPELAVDATAEPSRASLAGRSRPSVWFGTAIEVQRPVAALLVEGETATWDEVRALVGTRCLYRAPYGGVARVAVTGARAERTLRATSVTIDQEEVDQ